MIGAIVIILILIVASIPKVPVSQQYVTTTQTQLMTTTQFQTVTVTQTVQTGAPAQLVEYCFSPGGNCANRIIYWIGRANTSIHVLIYSFTLDSIRVALVSAKSRNVDVKVVMDNKQAAGQGSEYQSLLSAGIDIKLDRRSADMHDKVVIIDSIYVITGSFNWSAAANEDNNENLIVIHSQTWGAAYETEFQRVWTQYT
jgi:phosphatidylserine/phosphatidylglycerophosphate/cardiolipin synthase-like enzyme